VSASGGLHPFLQSLASQLQQHTADAVDAHLQLIRDAQKTEKATIATMSQLELEHPSTILKFNIKAIVNTKNTLVNKNSTHRYKFCCYLRLLTVLEVHF